MRRREILWLLAASTGAWSHVSNAQQQASRIYRVGYLGSGTINQPLQHALLERLRDLGWIEGKNLFIDYRFAEGRYDTLPDLANELIQLGVDVIVASPTPAALAAKKATQTIPIVGISFDNPIENELVASLARPGGNVTGLSYGVGPDIFGKDLELLREVLPHVTVVAVLSNPSSPNHAAMMSNVSVAAHKLDIRLVPQDVSEPGQFEDAFAGMLRQHVGALFVFGDPMLGKYRTRIAELAMKSRLPSMHTNRPHVEAGGLMSYGPSFTDLWQRAAVYVDKILKGTKPADLPVEQPTKFELVINLKTAKALGVTIPPQLLARADEVIE